MRFTSKMIVATLLFSASLAGAVAWSMKPVDFHQTLFGYEPRDRPTHSAEAGVELTLVYIGSNSCGACNHPRLPQAVDTIRMLLRERVGKLGIPLSTVGIGKNWDPADGLAHLRRMGAFDEVMAGRSWLNIGALQYIWQELPGPGATPQLLLLARRVSRPTSEDRIPRYGITPLKPVLVRKVGLDEIFDWLADGVPFSLEGIPLRATKRR